MVMPYYSDGQTAIYRGDCAEVLPALGVQPDLIVTSPPYDKLRDYGGHGFDFDRVADALVTAMPPGGVLVWVVGDAMVDGSETGTSFRQALGFMERGLRLHDTMIYQKSLPNNPTPNRYGQTFEYMFVLSHGAPSTANLIKDRRNSEPGRFRITDHPTGRNRDGSRPARKIENGSFRAEFGKRFNIWRYSVGLHHSAPDFLEAHRHPAIFPLQLAKDHILTWSNPGDVVLDPMMGSGTVLAAAKDTGRVGIGIEVEESYCGIAARRLTERHPVALAEAA